ncbi:hypothetical protein ABE205_14330 [Brevibacillus agri]|uniref:hypothetical protein n=1 Tax=Brevibacillus TaxID=55080 RepID=UPI000271BC1E|nr:MULTISPECIES: hypothetical protein [Brevibacillus]EJL40969.1 hypothetical protein PMI08_04114 [Brevibacillus sp. CF112]MDR9503017.1 hypothetical protein [Brevibacillus agri]
MLHYTFAENEIEITEKSAAQDTTFTIAVKSEEMRRRLKQVRHFFEENKDYTDVLFYSRQDGTYEVIVRHDQKHAFLIHAFRCKCLTSLRWA